MLSTVSTPDLSLISKRISPLPGHPHSGSRERRTNQEKLKMIKYIKENQLTRAEAASLFKISSSFIDNMMRDEAKIRSICNSGNCWKDRKITQYKTPVLEIENQTVQWIDQCNRSNTGVSISYLSIKLYAFCLRYQLLQHLYEGDQKEKIHAIECFTASNGWIQRLEERNNIHRYYSYGEEKSVNIAQVEPKMKAIIQRIKSIEKSCILNLDETCFYYQNISHTSIQRKSDERHMIKDSKKRVTVTVISSQDGFKLPLQIINKSKHPICLKGCDIESSFGVWYDTQPNSWQDSSTFIKLMKRVNDIAQSQSKTYYILLDNASCHLKGANDMGFIKINEDELKYQNLVLIFLPANSTSICQPSDRGLISCLKRRYHCHQILDYLSYLEETNYQPKYNLIEYSDIKRAMEWLSMSWLEMDPRTIINCFNNVFERFGGHEITSSNSDNKDVSNPKYNENGFLIEI